MFPTTYFQDLDDPFRRGVALPEEPGRSGSDHQPDRPPFSISDLVGGRVLAWLGGLATVVGIVLFLAVAIARGWITVEARVAGAGLASLLLGAAGAWLHARRGRTEASIVLVGAATAGLFATLVVAGNVYGLISPLAAVGGSMLVGALATVLAIRWAGQAIGALGLLGALVSPVLVGAPSGLATTGIVAVATAFAMWTVVSQRWGWLGLAAVLAAAPQWGWLLLSGQPLGVELAVLVWFGGLGLAGAVGMPAEARSGRLACSPLLLAALSACLVGPVGWLALDRLSPAWAASLWLGGLAVAHLALGLQRTRRLTVSAPLRRLLVAIGVILGDVAFGLGASGITLAFGWGAAAVGFAWLTRRTLYRDTDNGLLGLAAGGHVALALTRVMLITAASHQGAVTAELGSPMAVGVLAASCLVSGQLISLTRWRLDLAFNAIGLAAIAYLTSQALTGSELVAAWAAEAAVLARLADRTGDGSARCGSFAFLALSVMHALALEAPPTGLISGVSSLGGAVVALGSIAVASLVAGQSQRDGSQARWSLVAAGAGTLLYLASVAITTTFQPVGAGHEIALLDLSVRQEGQVLLSVFWSLTGLIGLVVGLRRNHPVVRNVSLGLLLFTVAKVFLYDLSTLTSLYRVVSFIALGLLLLAGAFAYQRLRPPPAPDMRSVHRSQR